VNVSELKETFEMQAEWRRQKAAEYPDDSRNTEAAKIFDRLAATVENVPPDVLAAYEELFDDLPDVEVHQEMLRQVGFYTSYDNAEDFVREFISKVTSGH
jgi:hypothetical protein